MPNITIEEIVRKNKESLADIVNKTKEEIKRSGSIRDDTVENGRLTGVPRFDLRVIPEKQNLI